jgi:hypothetical protein
VVDQARSGKRIQGGLFCQLLSWADDKLKRAWSCWEWRLTAGSSFSSMQETLFLKPKKRLVL